MPLTEAVWLELAMQVFGQSVPPFVGGSKLVPQGSGCATLFASSDKFFGLASMHTLQMTDRQTDGRTQHRTITVTNRMVG